MTTFTFPFPPSILSPNTRAHWAKLARAKKAYRQVCRIVSGRPTRFIAPVIMTVTFHPPDRRRRDRDNMIAASKAGQDGLSDALGVDDADFVPTYRIGDPVRDGAVVVSIHSAAEIPFNGIINSGAAPCPKQ